MINVTKIPKNLGSGWNAQFEDKPGVNGDGESPEEAVGDLIELYLEIKEATWKKHCVLPDTDHRA